jgi:hypothetical protein
MNIKEQLETIARLPWWATYGERPNAQCVRHALWVAESIKDFPKPFVNPFLDGKVQFEWSEGDCYFDLVVGETTLEYLYTDRDREESGTTHLDDLPKLLRSYGMLEVNCYRLCPCCTKRT